MMMMLMLLLCADEAQAKYNRNDEIPNQIIPSLGQYAVHFYRIFTAFIVRVQMRLTGKCAAFALACLFLFCFIVLFGFVHLDFLNGRIFIYTLK